MRTGNPALNDKVFQSAPRTGTSGEVMTLEGAVNKSFFALILCMGAGYISFATPEMAGLTWTFLILSLVLALALYFKPVWAPMLVPAYALVDGLWLGTISRFYYEAFYPGIIFQAISLTFGIFFCLLMAYKSGLIKATENFKLGVVAATGGIFVVYLLSLVLNLFGVGVPYIHGNGMVGIGFSLFVVGIAALNLVLDFDFIENGAASGTTPKYMEWYAAFGLLVTIVWLYVEILRLLSKLSARD